MTELNIENFSIDKSNWTKVKFGDVVYEPKESVKDPVDEGIEHVVGLEHINSEDIHLRRSASIVDGTTFTKRFRKGDVLFGRRRAYLKKAVRAEFEGICSGDIIVMRAKEELFMPELLPFLVNNDKFFDFSITHSAGGLSPRVKFKDLANYEIFIPEKKNQACLAKLLWAIDADIQKKKELIYKIETVIKTYKKDEFDAKHHTFQALGNCGKWVSGGTPSRNNVAFWGGDVPWVSPKDMKNEYINDSIEKVTEAALDGPAKLIPENAILMVVRGLILAHSFPVAKTVKPVTFNQDMKALLVSEEFDPEYLLAFLQHKKDTVLAMTTTTTHGTKRLASDTLYGIKVPSPPQSKQHMFVKQLEIQKKAITSAKANLKCSQQLRHSLANKVF